MQDLVKSDCYPDLAAVGLNFDHLQESFSHKEVQFKTFFPPVETGSPAVNANESPTILLPTGFRNMHSY